MTDNVLAPLYVVGASTRTVRITETAGSVDLTLDLGTYYGHKTNNSDYPGFFYELQSKIDASALVGTYVVEAGAPNLSPSAGARGLVIRRTAGSGAWSIDFSSGTTIDPEFLGMASSESTDRAAVGDVWRSDFCRLGCFIPHKSTQRRERDPVRDLRVSTEEATHDQRHIADFGQRDHRLLVWQMEPAAYVLRYKGDDPTYAAIAKRGTGDTLGAFERVYSSGQDGGALLVCHGTGLDGLELDQWEAGKLKNPATPLRSAIKRLNTGGEYYEVSMLLELIKDAGDYFDRART